MITVSFDPDAGTLYWYFADIIAGATTTEGECAATLLLDAHGNVIGIELELDESIDPADLTLALAHPQVRYDSETFLLTVLIGDQESAEVQPLDDPAILDFDAAGSLLGCEVITAELFGLDQRLNRLSTFMVEVGADDDSDDRQDQEIPAPPVILAPLRPRTPPSPDYRSGFVALVGRPNVGKSTLLNALLGQKVAIVSPRPQTTRTAIRGILTRPDAQVIFVDTPGIHQPRTRLGSYMVEQARKAIPDADVIGFVVDISEPPDHLDQQIATLLRRARPAKILVLNKVDMKVREGQSHMEAYRALGPWDMEVAVSGLRNQGLDTLVEELVRRLPPGPAHYPEDQVTDQTEREQFSELVREQVLRFTEQEVPHSVAVEVEEWEEKEHALYIRMTVYVEKDSQKGIIIGAGGAMLKRIGSAARQNIEAALGRAVYLDLWVKARPNWRDDPSSLRWLGYKS